MVKCDQLIYSTHKISIISRWQNGVSLVTIKFRGEATIHNIKVNHKRSAKEGKRE